MVKYLIAAVALMVSASLWAAPAMAQSEDNLASIQRGAAEGTAETTLGKKGLVFTTDGFQLKLSTQVQFRLTYQNEVAGGRGQDEAALNGRDFINFRIRRAKSTFEG
jgi:hypothetical protein